MSTKRKAFRYGLKKQDQSILSKKGGIATSMKLLRSVLAVGFAMTPFMGGSEALAAGIVRVDGATGVPKTYLQDGQSHIAHIYAEQASDGVGLNRFQSFDVGGIQSSVSIIISINIYVTNIFFTNINIMIWFTITICITIFYTFTSIISYI